MRTRNKLRVLRLIKVGLLLVAGIVNGEAAPQEIMRLAHEIGDLAGFPEAGMVFFIGWHGGACANAFDPFESAVTTNNEEASAWITQDAVLMRAKLRPGNTVEIKPVGEFAQFDARHFDRSLYYHYHLVVLSSDRFVLVTHREGPNTLEVLTLRDDGQIESREIARGDRIEEPIRLSSHCFVFAISETMDSDTVLNKVTVGAHGKIAIQPIASEAEIGAITALSDRHLVFATPDVGEVSLLKMLPLEDNGEGVKKELGRAYYVIDLARLSDASLAFVGGHLLNRDAVVNKLSLKDNGEADIQPISTEAFVEGSGGMAIQGLWSLSPSTLILLCWQPIDDNTDPVVLKQLTIDKQGNATIREIPGSRDFVNFAPLSTTELLVRSVDSRGSFLGRLFLESAVDEKDEA